MKKFYTLLALLFLLVVASNVSATHFGQVVTFTPSHSFVGYGQVGGNFLVVPSNQVFLPPHGVQIRTFHSPNVTVDVNGFRTGHFGSFGFARRGRNVTIIQSGGVRTFVFP